MDLLLPEEIDRIEKDFATGIPVGVIVGLFVAKGMRLSEATFRKYVQAGLLPQSRRVGKKGKHQGSRGLYPVSAVRRMNAIRQMMAQGLTLEDIKASFLVFKHHLDLASDELNHVLDGYERHVDGKALSEKKKKELLVELNALRSDARELVLEMTRFGSGVTARSGAELSEF
jgi:DNA-binding transcriptional MerR regulator